MTINQYYRTTIIHAFVRIYNTHGFYNTVVNFRPYLTLKEAVREQIGEGTVYSEIDQFNNIKSLERAV